MEITLVLIALFAQGFAYDFKPLSEFTNNLKLTTDERQQIQNECGIGAVNPRVGQNIDRSEAPWMVSFDGGCTGVLISKRHILAPAHCFSGKDISTVRFYASCNKANANCTAVSLENKTIAFELYPSEFLQKDAPRKHFADIALIVLDSDVKTSDSVKPICLAGDASKVESALHQFFYHDLGYIRVEKSQRIFCPWSPEEPDFFCSATSNYWQESLYIKQNNERNYLVAIGHPIEDGHHRIGHGTHVAPHLFWICEASGVCVKNKSGESLDHIIIHKSSGEPSKYVRVPLE